MPDPVTHTSAVVTYGWFGALVAMLFKVPPDVVLAAFVGSLFAVMALHQLTLKVGVPLVLGMTFVVSILVPDLSKTFEYSQAGIAVTMSFCLIYFWPVVAGAFSNKIKSWGEK